MLHKIVAIATLLLSSSVWAQQAQPERARNIATLKEMKGSVLVEQDAPFAPGRLTQALNEGDRVKAGMGESSAVVEYSDGCELEVDPGTTVTLPQDSPCACALADAERDKADGKAPGPVEDAENVAQLEEIEGIVLVNQGVEYVPGTLGQSLDENDRVMAEEDDNSKESSALIKYEDGCDIRVEEGTIVTVPETSPCACGIVVAQNAAPLGGAVIGAGVAGVGVLPIVVVGAIATGVITILLGGDSEVIEEDDDETVSP